MKRTATAVLIAGSLSFLVACGGEDSSSSTPSTPPANTPSADDSKPASNPFAKAKGKVIYNKTCLACHGENGLGVENLGKSWVGSEFIQNTSDEDMIAFIKAGRTADDPANSTGVAMPPFGGDPTLTDTDLENVVAFMRSLQ